MDAWDQALIRAVGLNITNAISESSYRATYIELYKIGVISESELVGKLKKLGIEFS